MLVTGAAGFLGFHVARRLLAEGRLVHGLDAFVGAADPALQATRWRQLQSEPGFSGYQLDLGDADALKTLLREGGYRQIVHLAARVGVRESVRDPEPYLESNLRGFLNLLEACSTDPPEHLVYASSSSVYGETGRRASQEGDRADAPVSFYAATKRANELMAHAWSSLYGIPASGLRFFTVYGPWGRPEMAVYRFVRAIEAEQEITLYDGGRMRRDFTFVDDAVSSLLGVLQRPPQGATPARVLNVGGGCPVPVLDLVRAVEAATGRHARLRLQPGPAGDVVHTEADASSLHALLGEVPCTTLEQGLRRFVAWYRDYHEEELITPLRRSLRQR